MGEPHARALRETAGAPSISATDLVRAFAGGAEALRRQTEALNAINVFPVPDGDTGTNMQLTMRAAVDEMTAADVSTTSRVLNAIAQGALMGAKGNSGVILSQILRGIADGCSNDAQLDGQALAEALERARAAAYSVVSQPREGTILTAITGASEAARIESSDAIDVLAAAVDGARNAVERTPELLPLLKEAGVVDAGAQGLFVLFDGMLRTLRGEPLPEASALGQIDQTWLSERQRSHDLDGAREGFCTEFVIGGGGLDDAALRSRLADMGGQSVLVIGDSALLRVHVHTEAPDDILAYARTLGDVSREKVDDMEAQFRSLAARREAPPIAVVAVCAGDGIEDVFLSMGAHVVRGGQTMNPSAGEIRKAIESTGADDVFVLPNNKNIVMAAKQAAEGLAQRTLVIETRSVPQGIAAMIAFNPESPLEEIRSEMTEAASSIGSAEVTLAARATTIHGMRIVEGQPIGLVDGDLVVAEQTIGDAARACVRRMVSGRDGALVTLYHGEGADADQAEALAASLRDELSVDVEVVAGGQPHYPYLLSVE